jgi:small subunit ribosomal protein S10
MPVYHLTGSTASTFLEYIQRNIPEGVAMKVSYEEIEFLPESIREIMENQQPSINSSPNLEQK